ncbi:putative global transcription activator SNF2L2 [Bienertia sinuspersici]
MRFLHGSVPTVDGSFNRAAQMLPPPPPSSAADSSGFGWLPSPKSPCPLLSPNLIFSPTGNGSLGFPQLPASPTMSGVPSPK